MAADGALFLAIDQGGHSSRVVAADRCGRIVATAAHAITTCSRGDRVEQEAGDVLESVLAGVREVADALGSRARELAAAGLAVQRASVVCWDRTTGAALSPVLSWLDRRGAPLLAAAGLDQQRVRARTGLHLSPHYGAAKLAWCLQELPAVRRAAAAGRLGLGPLSSYLVWQLSGGAVYRVDATTAQRTLLWDRATGDWSPELCEALGVAAERLPRVVRCDAGFGDLDLGEARVPLTHCAGDQGLVLSAYGAPDPDTVYINAGTGAFVLMPLADGADPPDRGLLQTLAWAGRERTDWAEEGTVNGAAAALDLVDADGFPLEPGDEPFFLNGVGGLGAPWWIADYRSRFIGAADTPAARERLVVESIVYLIMANVQRLYRRPRRVLLTGGIAGRPELRQWLADALDLPVAVPADREATLRGLLATLAPAIAAADAGLARVEPEPGARARWRERQARWESLLLAGR